MKKFVYILFIAIPFLGLAQEKQGFTFTDEKVIEVTPVKDQNRAGTCWSYATTSFIEAELIRMGMGEFDLSEQFFVRKAYEQKAQKYFRLHGKGNFSQGGQAHDVLNVIREYGIYTDAAYSGLQYGEDNHVHGEMEAVLSGIVEAVIKNKNRKVTPVWQDAFSSVLDTYLGEVPASFEVNGKTVNAKQFQNNVKFNPDDYIEITSYQTYPFYKQVNLEIPDNWSGDLYYNVPMNELMQIIHKSLENGYTVCWDGDVSEKGFSHGNNVAILPETKIEDMANSERLRWESMSAEDMAKQMYSFDQPVPEVNVTDEKRQATFDSYNTTDDHLMHLYGIAKDQNGTYYYMTKNSWASDSNDFGGNLYMSEAFVKMKTVAIMVHKDAIPKEIAKKLNIQ